MSVLDKDKIDGMAVDEKKKCVRLLITDHLDWNDEYNHLLILQEKINAYILFCEERQYMNIYKDIIVEYAVFEIHFKYEPTNNAIKFLEQVQLQVHKIGITLECHISGGVHNEIE